MSFDPKKPCQTRDGHPVTIVATDWPGPQPILGRAEGSYEPQLWSADGSFYTRESLRPSSLDLINIQPKPKVGWIFMPSPSHIYGTREEAERANAGVYCIAKIEWEE